MPSPILRHILVLAALGLLAGCGSSIKVAYNNADTLLMWQLKRYVDLQPPQEQTAEAAVERLHAWHRQQELPRIVGLVQQARQAAADGLSSAEAYDLLAIARTRFEAVAERASADAAVVLSSLSAPQREGLRQRLAQDNRRFAAEYVEVDATKLRQERAKRVVAAIERVYGELRPDQRALVRAASVAMPLTYVDRLTHRERLQRELLQLLDTHANASTLQPALRHWLTGWDANRTPAHAERARQVVDQSVRMLVDLDRTLTPAQRRTLIARLDTYASDFSMLAALRSQRTWQVATAPARTALPQ